MKTKMTKLFTLLAYPPSRQASCEAGAMRGAIGLASAASAATPVAVWDGIKGL